MNPRYPFGHQTIELLSSERIASGWGLFEELDWLRFLDCDKKKDDYEEETYGTCLIVRFGRFPLNRVIPDEAFHLPKDTMWKGILTDCLKQFQNIEFFIH